MVDENQKDDQNNQTEKATIEQLQADFNSAMNGWKRTAADFENYRKRKEAENKELLEFAKEVTVAKLLPTIDSLEQALKHLPVEENQESRIKNKEFFDKYQNWQKGIEGILLQLDKALEDLGVKKIEAVGKKFDPYKHEAVRQVDGEEDEIVVDELQSGFELNGKVIRPSQVIISKKINSDPNAPK
jgi:molecular chaperone GrpE